MNWSTLDEPSYRRDKNERKGRDPSKGEDMILRARKVVVFKWSGILKDKINGAE